MSRLPIPGKDVGTWGIILNDYLSQAHQADGTLKDGSVNLDTIATNTVVDLTGDQTVAGVKNFTSSPLVPTPTAATQAANKEYVDANAGPVVPGNTTGATAGTAIAIDSVGGTTGQTIASSDGSIALGYNGVNAASATGSSSVAIGADSVSNGEFALALGSTASATGDSSTAIGWGAEANGEGAVALGGGTYSESGTEGAFADGYNTLAIGSSSAQGYQSIAVGSSGANGYQSTAMGFNASAQGDYTTALGSGASSSSNEAVSVGFNVTVDNASNQSSAFGSNTYVYNSNNATAVSGFVSNSYAGTALNGVVDTGNYSLAIGGYVNGTINGSANGAVAIGTDSSGAQSQAFNDNEFALGTPSHTVEVSGTFSSTGNAQFTGTVVLPQTVPSTPADGQIWIASDGLYFQSGGVVHGPFVTP